MRVAAGAAALGVVAFALSGCTDAGDDAGSLRSLRSFELEARPFDPDASEELPGLSDRWRESADVVVISAPSSVEAGTEFPVEVELRNRSFDGIDLDPCPTWIASIGESGEVSTVEGALPCEEIGSIDGGERVRLRLQMPATERAVTNQGGEYVSLVWSLRGGVEDELRASIAIPMTGAPAG